MMSVLYEYYEDECPWYYFDSSYKTLLGACLIIFGTFGVLVNGWLFATFVHSHLLIFRSHILVLNLCTASFARNLLGFPFASASAIAKRWLFGVQCCHLFAFFNQFLGVFQIVAMLTICVERYYLVKSYKNDKKLCLVFYWLMVGVCWCWALALSVPPLFGFGKYSCDAIGTSCAYLWPPLSAGNKEFGFALLLIFLGGFIPVIFIFFFITRTAPLERRLYRSETQKEQRSLTRSLSLSIVTSLFLWIPAALVAAWQWVPLLIFGYRLHTPPGLVLIAPVASEAATSVPVLCYLLIDERLRAALLGRMRKNYALLRPERAKKYYRV